jgi:hypothetical protein
MRRFRHTVSSRQRSRKKRAYCDDNAASRIDSIARGDRLAEQLQRFESLSRGVGRNRSNPYFPGTKCISSSGGNRFDRDKNRISRSCAFMQSRAIGDALAQRPIPELHLTRPQPIGGEEVRSPV